MSTIGRHLSALLVACLALCLASTAHAQESRVALVIGNAAYAGDAALRNPVNDARAMKRVLEASGFEVIARENAGRREMSRAVHEFRSRLRPGGVAVFYYSGHGMQVNGVNYLMPVGAALEHEADLCTEMLDVNEALRQMEEAQNQLTLVILDACRNNPFERRFRSVQRGLASISGGAGTVIAYATAAGSVAADGDGANGTYTEELLKAIATPGLKLEDGLKRTAAAVQGRTQKRQTPWFMSSFQGEFYFSGSTTASVAPPPAMVPPPPPQLKAGDLVAKDCAECPQLVHIPGGSFTMGMGETEGNDEGFPDERRKWSRPQVSVRVAPFLMGRTEVTVGEFKAFVSVSGHAMGASCWNQPRYSQSDQHPVVCVSWIDAQAYVTWLNGRPGKKGTYRLPSEAEWEYAARAGTTTARDWGEAWGNGDRYAVAGGKPGTSAVASLTANAWGLHDMIGNVWEWTQDCDTSDLTTQPTDGSAKSLASCLGRVLRGGSWGNESRSARAGYRSRGDADVRDGRAGFRVARTSF